MTAQNDSLRSDMTGQIDNVNGRIDAMRSDMTAQNDSLRSDMTGQIDSVNGRIDAMRSDITAHHSQTDARLDALSKEMRIMFIAGATLVIGTVSVATAIIALSPLIYLDAQMNDPHSNG